MTVEDTCEKIRAWHRRRVFAMDQRKRNGNAMAAFLRVAQGWNKDLPLEQRKPIEERARQAIAAGEARFKGKPAVDPMPEFADMVDATMMALSLFEKLEEAAVKEMEALAKTLPVWGAWASGIHGLGARALAVIVGEAGNLDGYDDRSELWKRLGLAVMGGIRQGGLRANAKADLWLEHGYSKRRRSLCGSSATSSSSRARGLTGRSTMLARRTSWRRRRRPARPSSRLRSARRPTLTTS